VFPPSASSLAVANEVFQHAVCARHHVARCARTAGVVLARRHTLVPRMAPADRLRLLRAKKSTTSRTPGLPADRSGWSQVGRDGPLAELLGQRDDDPCGAADVAEPVAILVLRHLADEFRAVGAQVGDSGVDVVDGEHDAP